ncbi:MAG: hypothetical protein TR69_WS6001000749 [candidate division WS6 bacterium OLB20]|uniref:Uncharacterized protein n=1 Tax=candidate division WS6 bacterium OLB20 TaxID=1617426 RepID=A0A136LYI2_9BACT|nr:MAG: hypothetical protein TR69_WS6001000749 [candidate division WS6 bacterium OLB20]
MATGINAIRGEIGKVRADLGEVNSAGKQVGLERQLQDIELQLQAGATPENKAKAVEALRNITGDLDNVMDQQDAENYLYMTDDAIDADLILRTGASDLPPTHPLYGTVTDVLPTSRKKSDSS